MIGLRPCTYACALYVDPVLANQSYDISINTSRTNMSVFLVLILAYVSAGVVLAYTCACASGIVCLCSCLRACENQAQ